MDTAELLTVQEAAERLRISRWLVYELIRSRRLRTVKIGSRRLVPPESLRQCVNALLDEEV